jgi:hypothetical protein
VHILARNEKGKKWESARYTQPTDKLAQREKAFIIYRDLEAARFSVVQKAQAASLKTDVAACSAKVVEAARLAKRPSNMNSLLKPRSS